MNFDKCSDRRLVALLVGEEQAAALPRCSVAELLGLAPLRSARLRRRAPQYVPPVELIAARELVVRAARDMLKGQPVALNTPEVVAPFLYCRLAPLPHEAFWALWLDRQNRLLYGEELFRGTLGEAAVYPREVVRACLRANAAAVIFAHNHPSGSAEPSPEDFALTRKLQGALALIDVLLLDHFIVGGVRVVSMRERGWS
jgi:DNA repair protein RadC